VNEKGVPICAGGYPMVNWGYCNDRNAANGDALLPVGKSKNVPAKQNVLPLNMAGLFIQNRLMIQEFLHLSHEVQKPGGICLKPERVQSVSIPEFSMIIM
jgi:hypothetical protein